MEAILEQLVRSPKLKLYVDELTQTLRREEAARARFRAEAESYRRAEFINGAVVEHMPTKLQHALVILRVMRLVSAFIQTRQLGVVVAEQALVATTRNDYAPDICFWTAEQAAAFRGDQTVYPVPSFVCEVLSPTTASQDRGVKFEDYAAHGVREYWIIDPDAKTIEQYLLNDGRYELACKVNNGTIASPMIQGFSMPVEAAFDDDANLQALWALAPKQP